MTRFEHSDSRRLAALTGSVRAAVELWYQPNPDVMLAADASVTTVGPSYSARGAIGWRVFDLFYLGPEAAAFVHDGNYRQARAGPVLWRKRHKT